MPSAMDIDKEGDVGDWRIALAARIAQDLPEAYPGGPTQKAGTPL